MHVRHDLSACIIVGNRGQMNIPIPTDQVLDGHIVEMFAKGNCGRIHGVHTTDQSQCDCRIINMICAFNQTFTYGTTLMLQGGAPGDYMTFKIFRD